MTASYAQRLAALRAAMKAKNIDAWIIPTADPHLSEYLPARWEGRYWLTGFGGTAGTLITTADISELWVDGRYWEHAEDCLKGTGTVLGKLVTGTPHVDSLIKNLKSGAVVGIAPDVLSLSEKRYLESQLGKAGISLRHDIDLLDDIWADRPGASDKPVFAQKAQFVPESTAQKIERIRQAMQAAGADHHLVSGLDDIAWITNLRGSDVPYDPIFLSYLLISGKEATLFVDEAKLDADSKKVLADAHVAVAPYADVGKAVAKLSGSLLINPDRTAVSTLGNLPAGVKLIEGLNPSTEFKACKSDAEIEHNIEAMVQDGVALCGFFAELEQKLAAGERISELDIDDMQLKHRQQQPNFVGLCFGTHAGFNANGSLPHYIATKEKFSYIEGQGLLLVDSGAHYHNGTTDITRMVCVGEPTPEQQRDYTLVLKAHIALEQAVFPENLSGVLLDVITRAPMWRTMRDYNHGTGHGVGYFLNVHQGPQIISYFKPVNGQNVMKAGMLTSDEPGLYRPGKWGIRIENLLVTRKVKNPEETQFGNYLCMEPITFCPIDTKLIDRSLMTEDEIQWLNDYHALVREKLAPRTQGAAREWLERNTRPI